MRIILYNKVGPSCPGSLNPNFLKQPSPFVYVMSRVEFNKMDYDENTVTPVVLKASFIQASHLYRLHKLQRLNQDWTR